MTCCGLPMDYQDVYGVRVWRCAHRSHRVYENLATGEKTSENRLQVHAQ
jgi:hypothetical protein